MFQRKNKPKATKRHFAEKPATAEQTRDAEVRRVSARFMRQPPQSWLSSGVCTYSKEEQAADRAYAVPDGRYRVVGLDPIYHFKGGKLVEVSRAGPKTDPRDLVEVP